MEKIKTITVDGVTYSVETDITGKADLVNGKVPLEQLPDSTSDFNFTGAYDNGSAYAVGDVATYDGKTWYRINSNGGNVGDTPSEGNFWTLIAQLNAVDITGKADKVNGKLPESQLPSGVLFPKLLKSNTRDVFFATHNYGGTASYDYMLPQGEDPLENGGSTGSFTLWILPREYAPEDWSHGFNLVGEDGNQVSGSTAAFVDGIPTITFSYSSDGESNSFSGWVYPGTYPDFNMESSGWQPYNQRIKFSTTYYCDVYIVCNVNS